ncbi:MAG TPA: hypothetical protein VLC95_16690 [Anaerolineae bacterium]|nr:hypothetical protein [Anaerolineae bacterium]
MEKQTAGPRAPQVSTTEAAQAATEEAVDQLCWCIAQILKRILDPAPSAGDEDADESSSLPGGQTCSLHYPAESFHRSR